MKERKFNSRIFSMMASLFIAAMFLTSGLVVMAQMSEYEPNDDFSSAIYVYDGYTYDGNADYDDDPSDFYQIYLMSGDVLTVTMLTSQLDMDLYDPYESWVDDSYSNDLGQPHIEYTAYTTGYYYIEVNCYSFDVDYTIEFLVNDQPSGGSSGDLYVGGDYYVSGDPLAELPELTVGNGAYWGGVKDVGEEFEQEIDQGLQDIEDLGFDVNYDINGGIGAYFGIEVVSDDTDIDGVTCYDVALDGAIAIDFGLSASVDGTVSESGYTVSMDGSGSGYVELEAVLDGHIYFTVDEMAIKKIELTFTANGHGEFNLDADMSMQGTSQSIDADGTMDIDDVEITFDLMFDPPLDIYQFGTGQGAEGIYEGKTWYVPGYDTDVSGSLNGKGTISYDVNAAVPGETPIDESETVDLATEIGNNDFSETIPGGEYDYWDGGGTMFTCTYASGDIFIIETDMGNAFGYMDYGTRQFDMMDPTSVMPSTGMQYDGAEGMITGMTMDGELMTEEVTADEVQDFTEDPLSEVKSETGGHSSGLSGGLLAVMLVGVIIIVVVVVVVVMMTKKKTPPQQYPPQQYQQPPPPPPEYQPQQGDQYQQPPQQGQYPPPPPPPPGQ